MPKSEQMRKEMLEAITELAEDRHRLTSYMRESAEAMIYAMRAHGLEEENIPGVDEIYASLKAANIAITAAWIARETKGNDESGEPPFIILGMWAHTLMQATSGDLNV